MIDEIIAGLLQEQPSISPKFFYDEIGSHLFEAITFLEEYYPTRTEKQIMMQYGEAMALVIGKCDVLLDLGAGNCEKGSALFNSLMPKEYRALDISKEFLEQAIASLQKEFPQIQMQAQTCDLQEEMVFPDLVGRKKIFFYPGSSIGNFDPDAALGLFKNIVKVCEGNGGLLIGVDLVKEHKVLSRAYNDALGITEAFNKNILLHLNRLVKTDFDLEHWEHYAIFNEQLARIEMHLRSTQSQVVSWPGGQKHFDGGALIHTENSYKYTQEKFESLLVGAGFKNVCSWTDPNRYFLVAYASA
ncbi:L-histidine N(alpha)-methyltransferase [Polynucleobacter sp. AP-Reno-20A-A9]|uniref:L-histidine N(alpha)-methyltransferase n=1 Tax=Polynucleobacter sp. AP-Reno-20A-A9 TaxID=2576925 RepID=UPI001C0D5274|nr:L-histidine N(alpha)-methyltransferase [Polynucleobacter sp. AP-Reno-20A-A9]MBU3629365.1 L-histidine N(alpha)-methyltransferase [Polynucleobacter sp. AP-Reno-20A-A9]